MHTSDTELLRASQAGDPEAFGRLVERYQRVVCAVAYSATGDPALSEDLAQDAFVTAWRRLPELRDPARFSAWMCGIVRNLARSSRRHQRRHAPAATDPVERLDNLPAAGPSALDELIRQQRLSVVWKALGEIPSTYREPLVLFYGENQSLKQVAKHLDLTEQTVKQRLCRGRKRLARDVRELVETSLAGVSTRKNLSAAVVALIALSSARHATALSAGGETTSMLTRLGIVKSASLGIGSAVVATTVIVLAVFSTARSTSTSTSTSTEQGRPEARESEPVIATPRASTPRALVELGPAELLPSGPGTNHEAAPSKPRRRDAKAYRRSPRPASPAVSDPVLRPRVIEHGPASLSRSTVARPSLASPYDAGSVHDRNTITPDVQAERPLPIDPPDLRARIIKIDL